MKKPANPSASSFLKALCILSVFFIAFLAVMAAAGFYCFHLPRFYRSLAKIEIRPNPFSPIQFQSRETAFQEIQSKQTLYPVIEALKLEKTWTAKDGAPLPKAEIYARLSAMTEARSIRNTDLIEIAVLSENRAEAADIANQIAVQFQNLQTAKQRETLDAGLAELREEVEKQRKATETARAAMQKLRQEGNIVDATPEQLGAQTIFEPQPPEKIETEKRYMEAKIQYLNSRKLLETSEARLSSESVQLKTRVAPLKIWEKAEPSIYPAEPSQRKLNAIMLGAAFAGAALGIVFALIMGLALRGKA